MKIVALILVMLVGPVGAELVQYRATAPTTIDVWWPTYTNQQQTVILTAQEPDTIVIDYTIDTVADLWRIDLMSFTERTYLGYSVGRGSAYPPIPAADLEWVPTSQLIDMDSWTTNNGIGRLMVVDGFILSGGTIAFTEAQEPINPGMPFGYDAVYDEELMFPIEDWAPENEYTYAAKYYGQPGARSFQGVTYTTFGPSLVVPEPSAFWMLGLVGALAIWWNTGRPPLLLCLFRCRDCIPSGDAKPKVHR